MTRFVLALSFAFLVPSSARAKDMVVLPMVTIGAVETSTVPVLPVAPSIQTGQEIDWVVETFKTAKSAADQKAWGPLSSVVLMALLSLFSFLFIRSRDLRDKLKPYMGEVAVLTGVLGYIGIALGALPVGASLSDWWGAIWSGAEIGFAAVGAYELLAKRLVKFWLPKLWASAKKLWEKIPE